MYEIIHNLASREFYTVWVLNINVITTKSGIMVVLLFYLKVFATTLVNLACTQFHFHFPLICLLPYLSFGSPRLLPSHARNKTLSSHIGTTFAVTLLTNTAGADHKFVQKGVWGEKWGIRVNISENLHVFSDKRCIWFCFI